MIALQLIEEDAAADEVVSVLAEGLVQPDVLIDTELGQRHVVGNATEERGDAQDVVAIDLEEAGAKGAPEHFLVAPLVVKISKQGVGLAVCSEVVALVETGANQLLVLVDEADEIACSLVAFEVTGIAGRDLHPHLRQSGLRAGVPDVGELPSDLIDLIERRVAASGACIASVESVVSDRPRQRADSIIVAEPVALAAEVGRHRAERAQRVDADADAHLEELLSWILVRVDEKKAASEVSGKVGLRHLDHSEVRDDFGREDVELDAWDVRIDAGNRNPVEQDPVVPVRKPANDDAAVVVHGDADYALDGAFGGAVPRALDLFGADRIGHAHLLLSEGELCSLARRVRTIDDLLFLDAGVLVGDRVEHEIDALECPASDRDVVPPRPVVEIVV